MAFFKAFTGIICAFIYKFWRLSEHPHASAEGPLKAWFAEAKNSAWDSPAEVKAVFCSADFLRDNRVVFNIGGNNYRLVVKIAYEPKIVFIRFIGTHDEYNQIDAASI